MPRAVAPPKKPAGKKLYSLPEKIKEGTVFVDLYKNQWRLGASIGIGGFGEIYTACKVGEKNYDYVIKCEPSENGTLFVEFHFYLRHGKLENIEKYKQEHKLKTLGMPCMYGHGSTDVNGVKHRFIVMPRLNGDIEKPLIKNGQLPEETVYRIAQQMMDVYEYIHTCGYIHGDLKAANILIGKGKNGASQAYLVDFGLASRFTTGEFKPDKKKMHNGTIEYTSRDAHLGVATRRSDMEILGYNMIQWLGGTLPWVKNKLLKFPKKVEEAKIAFMTDVGKNLKTLFPKGVPAPLMEYIKYVTQMKHDEVPNYDKCKKIFGNGLKSARISPQDDLVLDIKTIKSNNISPDVVIEETSDEEDRDLIGSEDDDDDVVFETKRPTKVAPKRAFKTTTASKATTKPIKTTKPSPNKRVHKPLKTTTVRSPNKRISPAARSMKITPSPVTKAKRLPRSALKGDSSPLDDTSSSTSLTPKRSPRNNVRVTPISARAKAKLNVGASAKKPSPKSSSTGKTVINNNLTPIVRPSKTYEFNFELDVSMDANVVLNVKRKKKVPTSTITKTQSIHGSNSVRNTEEDSSDAGPSKRIKVRKLNSGGGDADVGNSPMTPVVTLRKMKR